MSDAIVLRGIRAEGRHGLKVLGERESPQPFVVDLEVRISPPDADDISATADYRVLRRIARTTVEDESFELIEMLAETIAERVLLVSGVSHAKVRVGKPAVAGRMGLDEVAVVVERP